ncbi:FAD-linked oxidoreductase asqF [Trichinella pseudospiralis]
MTWLQGRLFAGCWICQQRWLAVMNEQDSHLSMPSQTEILLANKVELLHKTKQINISTCWFVGLFSFNLI